MLHAKPQSLQLQNRDLAFLRGLFESRVMTGAHAATLHFDGKGEYAKRRLRQLKNAGLIAERQRRVNEPAILFLTRAGFARLKSAGTLDGLPALSINTFADRADVRELTLRHELEVMNVKAALHGALAGSAQFKIQEFSTWPRLHQFEAAVGMTGHNVLVKPDEKKLELLVVGWFPFAMYGQFYPAKAVASKVCRTRLDWRNASKTSSRVSMRDRAVMPPKRLNWLALKMVMSPSMNLRRELESSAINCAVASSHFCSL